MDLAEYTRKEGRQAGIPPPERDRAGHPAPPQVSAANSNGRGDRGETPTKAVPPAAATESEASPAETSMVLEAMRRFVRADDHAAEQFIRACHGYAPGCTVAQMVEAISAKGRAARNKDNPVGFLLVAAARLFKTEAQPLASEVLVGAFSGEVQRKEAKPAPTITEMAERLKQFRAGGSK